MVELINSRKEISHIVPITFCIDLMKALALQENSLVNLYRIKQHLAGFFSGEHAQDSNYSDFLAYMHVELSAKTLAIAFNMSFYNLKSLQEVTDRTIFLGFMAICLNVLIVFLVNS